MRNLVTVFGLLSVAFTVHARPDSVRQPVEPIQYGNTGKLYCGTKWLMFETDEQDHSATVTFDGGASFPANRILFVGDSSLITLNQGGRSVSYHAIFDENSLHKSFRPENGLLYCRFKMP